MIIDRIAIILTALLIGACPGEKNDTDATAGPTTGGDETGTASESASSTDGASTDGTSEPTTTGSPTTPATSGESDSTSPGETSTGEPPDATVCQKYCVMLAKCVGLTPEEAASCPEDCEAELAELAGECRAAATATMACHAGLTCQQLEDLEQGEEGPCTDEAIAQEDVCGFGNTCSIGGGGGDGMCEWSRECAGEPTMTMRCDEAACECFEDEVKFGECASEPVCDDPDLLEAKALSCCGIGA
ncbi:hypothetical protein SAMN02745121_08699 [Nannocystis exedens]|uniref:Uncharacterized protein n=1 Tax=Nannocystis exedens TaxID=54 RepID=A0A1I2II01_9BACT|nr:hypothetical protein [Nannocystis exedens]PCC67192.1 hypothetical protein NAEX_00195 [Nannocystis exedens]SFF41268.1 hypothetical protein SAMN02745121_08699 [Nannocystis exedens]